ncbi:hypothetical protein EIN_524370 [Entamoeba invadens IP1]|uniref:Uncharacterized protein n=1 Tax=Entamoeba invadens IP1 TaxID=370355 RepID=A0A0A1UBK9_ENTIV|nr:hypothetical protein EIN_524370 [Entamoeba invadens IP1]ELP92499.1 hypothetical protein EIN_524370 [Entamoeba invadens IP1]|eukprot:XP_004259270.1 hypothetical protein EIN_524370 [Entamoeba invadens IP1]
MKSIIFLSLLYFSCVCVSKKYISFADADGTQTVLRVDSCYYYNTRYYKFGEKDDQVQQFYSTKNDCGNWEETNEFDASVLTIIDKLPDFSAAEYSYSDAYNCELMQDDAKPMERIYPIGCFKYTNDTSMKLEVNEKSITFNEYSKLNCEGDIKKSDVKENKKCLELVKGRFYIYSDGTKSQIIILMAVVMLLFFI